MSGVLGDHVITPNDFSVGDTEDLKPADIARDIVIVATKTYEVAPALKNLLPVLKTNTKPPLFVMLQNGWGSTQEAQQILPPEAKIFSGIIMTGFERVSPSHVAILAHADSIRAGSLFGGDTETLQSLFDLSKNAFLPFVPEAKIEQIILGKLIYNICLNPLGALRHCSYGNLMRNEETLAIMSGLADEAIRVLKAARNYMRFTGGNAYVRGELVPRWLSKVGAHRSSMLQDMETGRKTEIAYLNGAICAMGRQFGIETPNNDAIVRQIQAAEAGGANRKAGA